MGRAGDGAEGQNIWEELNFHSSHLGLLTTAAILPGAQGQPPRAAFGNGAGRWIWKSHQGSSQGRRSRFWLILMDSCWIQASQMSSCVPGNPSCRSSTGLALGRGEELPQGQKEAAKLPRGLFLKPPSPSISVLGGEDSPRFLG